MSNPKGYSSQTKLERLSSQFTTVEPIRRQQYGLSVNSHVYARAVTTDAAEAGSTVSEIVATSHSAERGDIINFTSGNLAGVEVKVDSVSANSIILAEDLTEAPAATDAFQILRAKYPIVNSDGTLPVSVSAAPIQFVLDTVDTEVEEDTGTPANNKPLPVKLLDSSGNENTVVVSSSALPTGAATEATLSTIDADTSVLAGAVSGTEMQVDVITSALPTGAATEATLSTIDADTSVIAGAVSGTEMQVDVLTSALPTGAATEATLSSIDTSTTTLAGAVSGSEMQVDVVTSALPTGAATEATLSSIDTSASTLAGAVSGSEVQVDVVASLPAGTNNIGDVDVLTLPDVVISYPTVVDFIDSTPVLDTSSTNIPASASTPVTIVSSLAAAVSKVQFLDTTGEFIGLYSDPAGSPVLLAVFGPGSDQTIELAIPSTTTLGLRNMANSTISTGSVSINFIG